MPRKSHETPKPSPRVPITRTEVTNECTQGPPSRYKTVTDFNRRLSNIKSLNHWDKRILEDKVVLKKIGYRDNTIRIQIIISYQSGNTRGRKDKRRAWVNVTNDPLPARKKPKKS